MTKKEFLLAYGYTSPSGKPLYHLLPVIFTDKILSICQVTREEFKKHRYLAPALVKYIQENF